MTVAVRNRILSDAERRTGALVVPEWFGPTPERGRAVSHGRRGTGSSGPRPRRLGLRSGRGAGDTRTIADEKE